jgi:[ribosomal protein S18]-alanine N-acetyltransferase
MAGRPKRRHVGSSPTDVPCRILPALPADAARLEELERRCFGDPWSQASFREALQSPWSFGLWAAGGDDEVLGYLIARDVAGSGEVLNLAVAPESRRRGIARALLEAGLSALAARGADEVFLEVRESNVGAQELYRSLGFRAVGLRAGYYRHPKEDALVLRLGLGGRV